MIMFHCKFTIQGIKDNLISTLHCSMNAFNVYNRKIKWKNKTLNAPEACIVRRIEIIHCLSTSLIHIIPLNSNFLYDGKHTIVKRRYSLSRGVKLCIPMTTRRPTRDWWCRDSCAAPRAPSVRFDATRWTSVALIRRSTSEYTPRIRYKSYRRK